MNDDSKLVDVAALGQRGVAKVRSRHGLLAVGKVSGQPFAVSNRCRHLGASLGEGTVTPEGCLKCPWHGAEYDVTTGRMTLGPQGVLFAPLRGVVAAMTNAVARLKRYAVVERNQEIDLVDP
ncbi:MAG: Rieske (2Fe-2S) protein [Acidimicrobiales bacterium]